MIKKIRKIKVVSYSIFLILIIISKNHLFSSTYEVGVNTIRKEIDFNIIIQDTLFVATGGILDFGEILKGSTGVYKAQTNIEIKTGEVANMIKLSYLDGELQKDNSQKIKITKTLDEKEVNSIYLEDNDYELELEEIDVYLKKLEEMYIIKENEEGEKEIRIPIYGEIREVGNVKLGKYEGNMRIQIELVSDNTTGSDKR